MTRLSDATLDRLPAAVARPGYDRARVARGIVHTFGNRVSGFENNVLGRFKNAVESAQYDKWEDNFAVFRLFEVAAQNFRD